MRRAPRTALLAAVLSAVAAPAAPAAVIGTNVPNGAASAPLVGAAAQTHAKYARAFMIWPGGATPDGATVAAWDGIVAGWNAAGLKGVIVVTGHGQPPGSVGDYASYVGFFAARYGSRVAAWEAWNEEDSRVWWGAEGGDPALYAQLLRATYPLVHPYAPLFVGGLTGNDYGFLAKVYDAGGGGSFDGVGVHTDTACSVVGPDQFYRDPNGAVAQFSFLGFRSVHDVMAAHGDGDKPIWMTEFGWSTTTQTCDAGTFAGQKPGGVGEADQARYLTQAAHCLSLYPYVQVALWFTLTDGPGAGAGDRYGLLRADGTRKPSYAAFVDAADGRDPLAGKGCGDFDGPGLAVKEPIDAGKFVGPLPFDVEAADLGGVGRITLFADGRKIRSFTTGTTDPARFPKTLHAALTWQGAKRLAPGEHTIKVLALDGSGNTTVRILQVRKVDPGSITQVATSFVPLRVTGSGATRTVATKVMAGVMGPAGVRFGAKHKVVLLFQKQEGSSWVTAHKYTKPAKRPVSVTVSLQPAKWRVQAVFPRRAPFLGTASDYAYFTVA